MLRKPLRMNMYIKILLLCTSSILAALLLLSALFTYTSAGTIYEQSKKTNIQLLQRLQDSISSQIMDIEDTLISLYNETDLMNDLAVHLDHTAMKERHFRQAYTLAQKFDVQDGVVAIYIYDDFDRLISSYRHASTPMYRYPEDPTSRQSEINSKPLRQFLRDEGGTMLVSSYYNQNRETDIVRFAINIFSQDGTRNQIGAVVCDMDSAVFGEVLKQYSTQESNLLWLQPTGDRPAVCIGERSGEQAESIMEAVSEGQNTAQLTEIVQGQVLFCLDIPPYNLTLYSLMPPTLLIENQKALKQSLTLIAALMVIVFAVISIFVAQGITRPLAKLTGTMRRIQDGETKLRVERLGNDEIGELGATFNQMLDQVETLLVQEYQMKLSLQQAQFDVLQAQINPHFLYNTLDTMSSIAQIQGCMPVSALSESLGNIFRYTLDISAFSTLEKELIHLKNYIYVMDVRMHSAVQYIYDVDDELLPCRLPRLTLQPLVENAILHGVRGVKHEKIIRVIAAREADYLTITVQDNGLGMDVTEINARLQADARTELEKGRSIGLVNINARIQMLYGSNFGVTVESEPGQGTVVTVRLPAVSEGEEATADGV